MSLLDFIKVVPTSIRRYMFLSAILALTIYVLNILKSTKDTLVVSQLGAELISTIKLFGVLPSAFIFVLFYTQLTNYLTRVQIYHFFNLLFNSFFILFAFVLYPNANLIHPDLSYLIDKFPVFRYQIIMIEHWSYSLFYIMSELWGNIMLSLMFWQVLNHISTVKEAKQLYPLLGVFGEIGLIMAGSVAALFTTPNLVDSWNTSLCYVCVSVFVAGCIISLLFHLLSYRVIGINKMNDKQQRTAVNRFASLKYVLQSRHLRKLIYILFCYGVSINLIEGVWKGYLKLIYPNSLAYGHYMALIQAITGVLSFFSLLFSAYILPKLSWIASALITPVMTLILGSFFFIAATFVQDLALYFETSVGLLMLLAVTFGTVHNILTKSTKFAFFEPTKEMVFITLNPELKTKGKGVVDIAGERLGKSAGAALQWALLSFTIGSSLVSIASMLFIAFVVIVTLWLYTVYSLDKLLPKKIYK